MGALLFSNDILQIQISSKCLKRIKRWSPDTQKMKKRDIRDISDIVNFIQLFLESFQINS